MALPELQWNTQERARREDDRRRLAEQANRDAEAHRLALARDLPTWKAMLANAERNLVTWQAAHAERQAAEGAAYQHYLQALHRETGGELPRAPGGELIVSIDMGEHAHPLANATRPARMEWEALKRARAATQETQITVAKVEAAIQDLKRQVIVCEQARDRVGSFAPR